MSQVSKPSFTSSLETLSAAKIGKNIAASTAPGVLERRNCTPVVIDVDVGRPVNPGRPSGSTIRLETSRPCLNSQQQGSCCVLLSS